MRYDVTPTVNQIERAYEYGARRREASRGGKCQRKDGTQGDLRTDQLGALAEIVVAEALGIPEFIPSVNNFVDPDIVIDDLALHVRHTVSHNNHLIVRDRDRKKTNDPSLLHVFVLVTGDEGGMRIQAEWVVDWDTYEHFKIFAHDKDGTVRFVPREEYEN